MRKLSPALALASLLAFPAAAQNLSHVRLEVAGAAELAAELELAGFDVIEGSVRASSLDLVVSAQSHEALLARGLRPSLIAVGRPYAEIQREALAGLPEAVPAGYSDLNGVMARMNAAQAAHPSIAKVFDLTQTYGMPATHQGRHLFAIKISDNVNQDEDEPNVMVVGEHHAREIVTPEIALVAMDKLVSGYGSNPAITAAVDGNEIWIAPLWNPDGYVHVFTVDNFWRKNRRNNGNGTWGVDQNRNYPLGWSGPCAGSSSTSNDTYKGPSVASEQETQTMMAWSSARRFAKVIDYHSYGQEVLWSYALCLTHPFGLSYLRPEAIALSVASGYGGSERLPSADGEHYEWQLANFANWAFLIETHVDFQPPYASAVSEANMLWNGILHGLQRPMPLWGHVRDVISGQPIAASVRFLGVNWQNGEKNSSGGPHGRYYGALPPGNYNVEFSAPCYQTNVVPATVTAGGSLQLEVLLASSTSSTTYCTASTTSIAGCAAAMGSAGAPSLSNPAAFTLFSGAVPGANLGIMYFSNAGQAAIPFGTHGGFICAAAPVNRTGSKPSGGSSGTCSGNYGFTLQDLIASNPGIVVAGATLNAGIWFRDPLNAPDGFGLSNGIQFGVCP